MNIYLMKLSKFKKFVVEINVMVFEDGKLKFYKAFHQKGYI